MSPLHIKQIDKKTIRNTPSHALDRILSINSNTAIIVIARTVSKSLYTMIFFESNFERTVPSYFYRHDFF